MAESPNVAQFWAPGTVLLETFTATIDRTVLHPVPTKDPNDPLNWSTFRKVLNFALVNFFVFLSFVQLDLGSAAWNAYQKELHFTVGFLNAGTAYNYIGLATGCIFFVPLVYKYGRRPLYILSTALQLAGCIWFGATRTRGDFIGSNLLSGFGGAICEIIAQITIADVFFLHQHATMNGWFLFAQAAGGTLGPVASGYVVDGQGWRWMWWWCVILFGVNLFLVIFFFEESKYMTVRNPNDEMNPEPTQTGHKAGDVEESHFENDATRTHTHISVDSSISMKSYRQRLAFITKTEGNTLRDVYKPLILLFRFPAIAYPAITFGMLSVCFAVLVSAQATYLFSPPWNFSASNVGLMNLALFVGSIPALFIGGFWNDKLIIWLAKRNGGVYEPEMRLWTGIPFAIVAPGAVLMVGMTLSYEGPWPLIAVGLGIFGCAMNVINDVALSYTMDCYHDIIGTAMVGVVFVRNGLSVAVLFGLTPWIEAIGLRNVFVMICVICLAILLLPIPLLIWGKKARLATATAYVEMAKEQRSHRYL